VSSIGDDGLTQIFDLAPKQLHYILNILESNELTKKQVLASEKKRSIIHLTRFASKRKTLLELICDHLLFKHELKKTGYADATVNIRRKIGLTLKQLKSLTQQAERQNILKRYIAFEERKNKKTNFDANGSAAMSASAIKKNKPRQVRMLSLTESHYKSMINSRTNSSNNDIMDEDGDEDESSLAPANGSSELPLELVKTLGMAQNNIQPLYSQLFAKVEETGAEGVSLKQLGTLFGFDFYKARRMGNNLQMHPDIVTIIKETNRGKAKYQTIMLRKFVQASQNNAIKAVESLQTAKASVASEENTSSNNKAQAAVAELDEMHTTQELLEESLVVKHECGGASAKRNIQALVSNRSITRQKLILDFIAEHSICTKYEINREIRNQETQQGLKGQIDSKTTKRMLTALEAEKKLKIFEINMKNVSYMCVRSVDLSEDDDIYKNYCQTFKRTFDADDFKAKKGMFRLFFFNWNKYYVFFW
jgi:hypothetical protein